jgi:hypothetical protein
MADTKISQMQAATTLVAADILPVVQSGINKKATVDTLSKSLTNIVCQQIAINSMQTITGNDAIDVLTAISLLSIPAGGPYNGLLTTADAIQGQEKLIVSEMMLSNYKITIPGLLGASEVIFTLPGQSVLLRFIHGQWYIVSSHGVTIG